MLFQFLSFFIALGSCFAFASQNLNRPSFEKLEQLFYTLNDCSNEIAVKAAGITTTSYNFSMSCQMPREKVESSLSERKQKLAQIKELIEDIRKNSVSFTENGYLSNLLPKINSQLAYDSNELAFLSVCRDPSGNLSCPESKTFNELRSLHESILEIKNNNMFLPPALAKKYGDFYDQVQLILHQQRQVLVDSAQKSIQDFEEFGQELGFKVSLPKFRFGFEDGQFGNDDTDNKIQSLDEFFNHIEENRTLVHGIKHFEMSCAEFGKNDVQVTAESFDPNKSPALRMIFILSASACRSSSEFVEEAKNNIEKMQKATVHLLNQTQTIQAFVNQTEIRLILLKAEVEDTFHLVKKIESLHIRDKKKFRAFYIATWGHDVEENSNDVLSINISASDNELLKALDLDSQE